jgi:hypothetical protein
MFRFLTFESLGGTLPLPALDDGYGELHHRVRYAHSPAGNIKSSRITPRAFCAIP